MTDETSADEAVLRDELRTYLIDYGYDAVDVDNVLPQISIQPAYWSDIYNGFSHDCSLHDPSESNPATCFPDTRLVFVFCNLPAGWLLPVNEDPQPTGEEPPPETE
jgi:hypothetical protein